MNPLPLFFLFQSAVFLYWLYLLFKGRRFYAPFRPSVTAIIPAYNEEENIGEAIASLRATGYPNLQIIVADGGSKDRTVEVARSMGVEVVHNPRKLKPHGINEALKYARGEVIVILDADTVVERDSIEKIVAPFRDPEVVVSAGKVLARGEGIIAGFQRVEYAFVSELMYAHARNGKTLPFVFGAFLAVRKSFLEEIGGVPTDTVGEDMDIFVTALERGKKVAGTEAIAITKVPTSLRGLSFQRLRWSKASITIALKHRRVLHRYPVFMFLYWPFYGLLGYPFLLEMFFRYLPWHLAHGSLHIYLLSWTSFFGPFYSLYMLPQWGFPPLTVLGSLLGILSFFVIGGAMIKHSGVKDFPFLFFFPLYGTFYLGLLLLLSLPYTLLTYKQLDWKR